MRLPSPTKHRRGPVEFGAELAPAINGKRQAEEQVSGVSGKNVRCRDGDEGRGERKGWGTAPAAGEGAGADRGGMDGERADSGRDGGGMDEVDYVPLEGGSAGGKASEEA